MKALITGSTGFVGPYLKDELSKHGYDVFGLDRHNSQNLENVFCGDITDTAFVDSVIKEVAPDEIYHLAGFSSIKKSFEEPELTMKINFGGTKNILEAVRKHSPGTKVLIVSSADVYGKPISVPITEGELLKETSPYSKSRIAQESLLNEFEDLFIVVSRSFNHSGPGQAEIFVLSDFAKQVVEIEKGSRTPVISTGNLDVVRDFSDVRDVVNAYYLLLQKGKKGDAYNVGSGKGFKLADLLLKMIGFSNKKIETKLDSDKMRPIEIPELVADISKIENDIGWKPFISIDETIQDLLTYWRNKL